MTTIAAEQVGGNWRPVSAYPSGLLGVECSPTGGYVCVGEEDYYATSPPSITGSPIVSLLTEEVTVSEEYFGMHAHDWPTNGPDINTIAVHSLRSHDVGPAAGKDVGKRTRWASIESADGVYDWRLPDRWVNRCVSRGIEPVYTLFATPTWASARPSEASSYGLGNAAEPANMEDWSHFCTTIATRYDGKVTYWEIWNEPNLTGFYTGTEAQMAEMTRLAATAIKGVNPNAKIIGPGVTSLHSTGNGIEYLEDVLDADDGDGGVLSDHLDIISVHLYPVTAAAVKDLRTLITSVKAVLSDRSITLPIWNTEYSVLSPAFNTQSVAAGQAQLARMIIVPAVMGIARSYWYGFWRVTPGLVSNDGTFDLRSYWNYIRSIMLSGPITACNLLVDGRVALVVNGQRYIF